VTVLNLQRLGQINGELARKLLVSLIVVFSIGTAALFLLSQRGANGVPQPDANATTVLDVGVAVASYIAQREAFRTWRASHRQAGMSSWFGALGVAVVYTLVWVIALLPVAAIVAGALYLAGSSV
jgi:hypothetical protein